MSLCGLTAVRMNPAAAPMGTIGRAVATCPGQWFSSCPHTPAAHRHRGGSSPQEGLGEGTGEGHTVASPTEPLTWILRVAELTHALLKRKFLVPRHLSIGRWSARLVLAPLVVLLENFVRGEAEIRPTVRVNRLRIRWYAVRAHGRRVIDVGHRAPRQRNDESDCRDVTAHGDLSV